MFHLFLVLDFSMTCLHLIGGVFLQLRSESAENYLMCLKSTNEACWCLDVHVEFSFCSDPFRLLSSSTCFTFWWTTQRSHLWWVWIQNIILKHFFLWGQSHYWRGTADCGVQRMDREYGSWPRAARWEEKRKDTEKIQRCSEGGC